jgi:hypothetical protein
MGTPAMRQPASIKAPSTGVTTTDPALINYTLSHARLRPTASGRSERSELMRTQGC